MKVFNKKTEKDYAEGFDPKRLDEEYSAKEKTIYSLEKSEMPQ